MLRLTGLFQHEERNDHASKQDSIAPVGNRHLLQVHKPRGDLLHEAPQGPEDLAEVGVEDVAQDTSGMGSRQDEIEWRGRSGRKLLREEGIQQARIKEIQSWTRSRGQGCRYRNQGT